MDLKYREEKIIEKRKNTEFNDFIKEIASRIPLVFHKENNLISRASQTDRIWKIVSAKEFEEIRNNLTKTWLSYNFDQDFFQNYYKLQKQTPYTSRMADVNNENADFAEAVWKSKNIYLSHIVIHECENVLYTFYAHDRVKNILNSVMVRDWCENIYWSKAIIKSYNIFYSKYIVNSSQIWFSTNLIWCHDCIFCDDLENKSYCINNIEYSPQEYKKEKQKILKQKNKFIEYYKSLKNESKNFNSKNTKWIFCIHSENIENGYFSYRVENARNIYFVWDKNGRKNVLDTFWSDEVWYGNIYGCSNIWSAENVYFCDCIIWQKLYYCFNCINCSYCLWCIGLKNEQFCILNKKYSKEDRFEMVNKIFLQMEQNWILWKSFPWYINPLYFNDTVANLINNDFNQKELEKEWYLRRNKNIKVDIPDWLEKIKTSDLNKFQWYDTNWKRRINSEILEKIIIDRKWNYYRIVKMEYNFLAKYKLPLPEFHWLDRIKMWLKNI